ncbi:MAG: hypothetical protein AAGJ70_00165 [Pseudomonadota bacterium]
MLKRLCLSAAAALAVTSFVAMPTAPAVAGGATASTPFYKPTNPQPQVRGSRQRVGGYSYNYEDSIIDFRDRSVFLNPKVTSKSTGPFDSGYFFDSGVERQNNSPYLY